MILEIDAGNSAVKWRYRTDKGAVRQRGRVEWQEHGWFSGLETPPAQVWVSNVTGKTGKQRILSEVAEITTVAPRFALVEQGFDGLQLSYAEPERLGVDRWLAMLAGRRLTPRSQVIVDAGSALTLDWVSADGTHRGGYILPGYQLMRQVLFHGTYAVKVPADSSLQQGWADNTQGAVVHGVNRTINALIQSVAAELLQTGEEAALIMTGGDAGKLKIAEFAQLQLWREPDLVMMGLEVAMAGTENP